jgi:hypothetical protein
MVGGCVRGVAGCTGRPGTLLARAHHGTVRGAHAGPETTRMQDDNTKDSLAHGPLGASNSTLTGDDASLIVRRALEILDAVKPLLEALSPSEIEAATARVYLGRLDGQPEAIWSVYGRRHQALVAVFASQHSAFAERARRFLDRHRLCEDNSEELVPLSATGARPELGGPPSHVR